MFNIVPFWPFVDCSLAYDQRSKIKKNCMTIKDCRHQRKFSVRSAGARASTVPKNYRRVRFGRTGLRNPMKNDHSLKNDLMPLLGPCRILFCNTTEKSIVSVISGVFSAISSSDSPKFWVRWNFFWVRPKLSWFRSRFWLSWNNFSWFLPKNHEILSYVENFSWVRPKIGLR